MTDPGSVFIATARRAFTGLGRAVADEVQALAHAAELLGKARPTEEELAALFDDTTLGKIDRAFAEAAAAVRTALRAEYDRRRAELNFADAAAAVRTALRAESKARPAGPQGSG